MAGAVAEWWIASSRHECLDLMLMTRERHLRLVLGEYADHWNCHRRHRGTAARAACRASGSARSGGECPDGQGSQPHPFCWMLLSAGL